MRTSFALSVASLCGATVAQNNTILSIKSGISDVDIRRLPQMLRSAGETPDQKIVSFLNTAEVTTLVYVHTQLVRTSASSIDSDTLCSFVTEASRKLSLQSRCAADALGEAFEESGDDLHLNDPDAVRKIKVAVIDSGIDWTDPDLAPLKGTVTKKSGGYNEGGWNFKTNSSTLTFKNTHGTSVSKLLAAKSNNSIGVAGIAPNVTLVPLQIFAEDSRASLSHFVAALEMAIDLEVDIISASLGFRLSMYQLDQQHLLFAALREVQQNGIMLISSAGNSLAEASDVYPCWYGGPLGICVASLYDYMWENRTEPVLKTSSNYGDRVDVAAYGGDLVVGRDQDGELITFSGTSAAQPLVAGLAAILLSMDIQPMMVKRLMLANTDPVVCEMPDLIPQHVRSGAVNASRLIQHAISLLSPTSRSLRGRDNFNLME